MINKSVWEKVHIIFQDTFPFSCSEKAVEAGLWLQVYRRCGCTGEKKNPKLTHHDDSLSRRLLFLTWRFPARWQLEHIDSTFTLQFEYSQSAFRGLVEPCWCAAPANFPPTWIQWFTAEWSDHNSWSLILTVYMWKVLHSAPPISALCGPRSRSAQWCVTHGNQHNLDKLTWWEKYESGNLLQHQTPESQASHTVSWSLVLLQHCHLSVAESRSVKRRISYHKWNQSLIIFPPRSSHPFSSFLSPAAL